MNELLSPKQAAEAIGVSESSLKRWCDRGLIHTVRTAGGHRKLPIENVIRFARENDQAIVRRDILGLPERVERIDLVLNEGEESLADSLLAGNEPAAKQIIFDSYLAKDSISAICDDILCKALRQIGERWESHSVEVYQERRSCEIVKRILNELRRAQSQPDLSWTACGGTFEDDGYCLPTTMVELVLRDAGWNATSLGVSIPARSMAKAILDIKPKLFWVCASYISTDKVKNFVTDFKSLWKVAQASGTALVIGGRAFTEELREQLTYCCHCDTMQQLEAFARSLRKMGSSQSAPLV